VTVSLQYIGAICLLLDRSDAGLRVYRSGLNLVRAQDPRCDCVGCDTSLRGKHEAAEHDSHHEGPGDVHERQAVLVCPFTHLPLGHAQFGRRCLSRRSGEPPDFAITGEVGVDDNTFFVKRTKGVVGVRADGNGEFMARGQRSSSPV
jgi:hypothetical protein